jgi:predicted metal-dependent HD superfamily phosphohydrolase
LLISKYSEKHRAYHNLSHINYLLRGAWAFGNTFHDYEAARLAVWFHDAIYEPKSKTNEIESAALAVKSLSELKVPKIKIEKVEKMILATQKHDAAALDEDGELFLDLDLSILGTTPSIYQKYAQAIRREYSFVPENLYREKRREVLRHFLQREFIYYTVEMREFYEEAAQINIANEIEELS